MPLIKQITYEFYPDEHERALYEYAKADSKMAEHIKHAIINYMAGNYEQGMYHQLEGYIYWDEYVQALNRLDTKSLVFINSLTYPYGADT